MRSVNRASRVPLFATHESNEILKEVFVGRLLHARARARARAKKRNLARVEKRAQRRESNELEVSFESERAPVATRESNEIHASSGTAPPARARKRVRGEICADGNRAFELFPERERGFPLRSSRRVTRDSSRRAVTIFVSL